MTDTILSLENIKKSFDGENVLKNISLDIGRGEFITLLGSTGCGKTTTIRIIAGLESPDSGKVILNGKDITGLAPEKRDVNTVFQNYALFPHMNVEKNIGYGLRLKKKPADEIKKEVEKALSLVQLEGFEKRNPTQLSGGQRQCLSLIMATLNQPKVLLLDEHTAALDPKTSKIIMDKTEEIVEKFEIPTLMITHNLQDAIKYGNRLIMLHNGKIILDIKGKEKEELTQDALMEIFQKKATYSDVI